MATAASTATAMPAKSGAKTRVRHGQRHAKRQYRGAGQKPRTHHLSLHLKVLI
jgi:hypothetical protein